MNNRFARCDFGSLASGQLIAEELYSLRLIVYPIIRKPIASLLHSRAFRDFVAALENKLPALREWHRFQYQVHFAQHGNSFSRLFNGVFASSADALAAIPPETMVGHDHSEAATRLTLEPERVWPSDYPVLFWLECLIQESSIVFDLGGAAGVSFYSYQKYIPPCTWLVCDLPAVVAQGQELAKQRQANRLSFTTLFERANDADILLASSSLQFIEDPLASLLNSLERKPRHLIINRTPFCDGSDFVTLNNMGPATCLYRIRNLAAFIAQLEALGYSLVDSWENPDRSCYIPFHPERSIKEYRGMYFTLAATRH